VVSQRNPARAEIIGPSSAETLRSSARARNPTSVVPASTARSPDPYSVSGSTFNLLFSCGDGCNGSGMFDMQFQSCCDVAILNEQTTQCTGNRLAVAGTVVLTRQ
jgi:hypothetical protein